MSRKSRKSSRTGARTASAFEALRLGFSSQARRSALRWAAGGSLLLAVLALVLGSLAIKSSVENDQRFCLDNWRIELVDLPDWVTPEIENRIRAINLGTLGRGDNLFQRGVLEKVRALLEKDPWIREVSDVDLSYAAWDAPGALEVQLRLRTPVALVEKDGLYYLTDTEGARLGAPYREAPVEWFRVPAIVNIPSTGPVPPEGGCWKMRDVQQGLAVAKILHAGGIYRDFPERLVQRIDLANLHGRVDPRESEIVLWAGGRQLPWGRSPISTGARTVLVRDVVANLRRYLSHPEKYGQSPRVHLDSPPGRFLIGVRG